jgi:hypothetical protein
MSLLGNNVFANPTTPLWGGGGGSNLPENPTFNIVTFEPSGSPPYSSTGIGTVLGQDVGSTIAILGADQTELGPLQATALYAGVEANYPRVIYQSDGIDYQAADSTSYFLASVNATSNGWDLPTVSSLGYTKVLPSPVPIPLATVDTSANSWTLSNIASINSNSISFSSNQMDLSNVASINGVPYFNSPGTQFDFRSYPGGSTLVEAPDWGVLNAISFTPPVDGKVYVESLGTYVALVSGGGVSMTFAVDGTNISETPTTINAYAGNTNLFGTSMFQFAVSANVTYDISSIAHCSAIPPADPDVVVTSSRMFLLFSPN